MNDAIAKGRKKPPASKGEKNGYAKLTAANVEQVREMIRAGKNNVHIGRVFGVTHQMISRIRRGKAWGADAMQEPYASLRR